MVSRVIPVDPFDLVIFGGTGDLAQRKILPALFRRHCAGQLTGEERIIGAARTSLTSDGLPHRRGRIALRAHAGPKACGGGALEAFLERVSYVALDALGEEGWQELSQQLRPGG